ncbi:MAG: helix-turn-helix domain-containing protein [Acutalibacteraceae bacterium]|nr:helix-turn-helix domain-containing protein [Acutalibacteraceae bacterium]
MSLFRLSNHIFELGLDAQELSVYAYLCSLPASGFTLQGGNIVTVKQRTIAVNCGIRSPVTVAKTIDRLREKGLVDYLERQYKANGHRGTYWYAVTKHPTDNGFFMVDRHIFGMLVPRQMLVYLFLCKSFSTVLHDCWNSYNDIAAQIGMKRESVIQTIRELVELGLIVRMQRRSKENRRVYVDNHYSIVRFEVGHIRVKMPKMRQADNSEDQIIMFHPAALCRICPEVRSAVWGSP